MRDGARLGEDTTFPRSHGGIKRTGKERKTKVCTSNRRPNNCTGKDKVIH